MAFISDKIMFEIYREAGYAQRYCVVYFTELGDGDKETEISRAMAGKHFYDGFIHERGADQAKEVIGGILDRLNAGNDLEADEVDRLLAPFVPAVD